MFCIYIFSDFEGLPIYVGKAKNFDSRVKQHLYIPIFKGFLWKY
jgi:excinuclease UvrABC nuclease subunit